MYKTRRMQSEQNEKMVAKEDWKEKKGKLAKH